MKARKGFTLVEVVACTVILAIVTIGAVAISNQILQMKTEARNTVYLSMHNLNTMERLRQMVYELPKGQMLLSYYNQDTFSSSDILTEVFIDSAVWDDFQIYEVKIESRMKIYHQLLKSSYTLTSIGGYSNLEDSVEGDGPYLGEDDVVLGG